MTGVSGDEQGRKHGQSEERVGKCGRKWGWGGGGEESTESDSLSGHSGFTNVMVHLTEPRNSLGRESRSFI